MPMIEKKVKSLWNGKVGLHEKYVLRAANAKQDMLIIYGEFTMLIPYADLRKVFKKGDTMFKDKFTGERYYLYYAKWEGVQRQMHLL